MKIFFKALANRFRLASKIMDTLLLNGLHEKAMICFLIRSNAQFVKKIPLPIDERRGTWTKLLMAFYISLFIRLLFMWNL